ncbi:ran-binding protein 9-like isoform X3 [Littorina saxatilis]|uniref:Ran-binding protein 9 n=1 Tax=Littorina saxatilis TaxID=31220 RepID=A0AAN9C015_9CAEN
MATGTTSPSTETLNSNSLDPSDPLKQLYPAVNEDDTPLPRSWSPKDKFNFIGLSLNNLRVHYKGVGKSHNHKDAASVRATHPIPAACGIYYFEVRIISKGRDGYFRHSYMGIGLSTQGVNMNKLPGWDKYSYGYHGDDGNAFCSSNPGIPYGPTFTTGDVIGCCVNLIDNTCFYTKNGINLGIAFSDLPPNLYPTVGLQTPGEVVEANFGQTPFVFNIEEYMKEWHMKTRMTIERFPVSDRRGEWQQALQRMVSTYLIHHGYCSTAEAFCKATTQPIDEDITSIKHRQRIQKLVLAGRMGEAIELTQQLYPGLLERNPNLLFMLKCRQFVEMVNGSDSEVRGPNSRSPRSQHSSGGTGSSRSSPNLSPAHNLSANASSSAGPHILHYQSQRPGSGSNSPNRAGGKHSRSSTPTSSSSSSHHSQQQHLSDNMHSNEDVKNAANAGSPQSSSDRYAMNGSGSVYIEGEENMDLSDGAVEDGLVTNGNYNPPPPCMNGNSHNLEAGDAEDMDVEGSGKQLCGGNRTAIEKMLQYGRELQSMSQHLRRQFGHSDTNKKAIQDAFSLLAYPDPWNSPVGFQLQSVQREPVCAALNSAILESQGLPKQPPLKLAIAQATQCMKLMAKSGIGACAFASVADYLH